MMNEWLAQNHDAEYLQRVNEKYNSMRYELSVGEEMIESANDEPHKEDNQH